MTVPHIDAPISRRMERAILALFVAGAAVMGVTLAVPGFRQLSGVAADRTPVRLLTEEPVPISGAGPSSLDLVSASFGSADVVASGLSDAARWLIASGIGFGALTHAATAGAVFYFLLLLMWRRPFHRSLILATQLAGAALLIGGLLSAGIGGLGRMMAADELNPLVRDAFVVGFDVDPAPIIAGAGVLALSFVFAYGTRLQRDTEGLV